MIGSILANLKDAAIDEKKDGNRDFSTIHKIKSEFNKLGKTTGYTLSLVQTKSGVIFKNLTLSTKSK